MLFPNRKIFFLLKKDKIRNIRQDHLSTWLRAASRIDRIIKENRQDHRIDRILK